jgi:hypothetical protein
MSVNGMILYFSMTQSKERKKKKESEKNIIGQIISFA